MHQSWHENFAGCILALFPRLCILPISNTNRRDKCLRVAPLRRLRVAFWKRNKVCCAKTQFAVFTRPRKVWTRGPKESSTLFQEHIQKRDFQRKERVCLFSLMARQTHRRLGRQVVGQRSRHPVVRSVFIVRNCVQMVLGVVVFRRFWNKNRTRHDWFL